MLKKLTMVGIALLVFCGLASAKTLTGTVSDDMCGAKKHDAACVTGCIGKGAKYVLVSKGKVYKVDAQDKFKDFAGKEVKVTGEVKGDEITVAEVAEAAAAK